MSIFSRLFGFGAVKVKIDFEDLRERLINIGNAEIEGTVEKVITDAEKQIEIIKAFGNEFNIATFLTTFAAIKRLVADAVIMAEAYSRVLDNFDGEQKKKSVVKFLDESITFPWVIESIDSKIFSWLVDAVVDQLNSDNGKEFLEAITNRSESVLDYLGRTVISEKDIRIADEAKS